MSDSDDEIPAVARPKPEETGFDLEAALSSVVGLRVEVPADAFTAESLGTERRGNGIVIGERGLVLTIGYLVIEAEQVWITTSKGTVAQGHVLAYDQATGFGLIQALGRLGVPAMPLGNSRGLDEGTPVIVAGSRGLRTALSARIVDRRPFAGYWEYYLEEALFTAPAHPHWGGAAVISPEGRLIGVGSLLVQEAAQGRPGRCRQHGRSCRHPGRCAGRAPALRAEPGGRAAVARPLCGGRTRGRDRDRRGCERTGRRRRAYRGRRRRQHRG